MLWRFRLPFVLMPVAVTLGYLGMDLKPLRVGQPDVDRELRKLVSLCFGLLVVGLAFWLGLADVPAFRGGLSAPRLISRAP